VIGSKVKSIGWDEFKGCDSLTNIHVDENNQNYMSIDGNLYSKDGKILIKYAVCKRATTFEIPNGVTSIGYGAFRSCRSLISLTIPESVTSIDGCAFSRCTALKHITIPSSIANIGFEAFAACRSLQYNEKDGLKYLGNDENKYLFLVGKLSRSRKTATIDSNCRIIGDYAFEDRSSLKRVTIPDGIISIGAFAFSGCSSLVSITIPNGITEINTGSFRDCCSLTSVIIPNSVRSIENSFSGCNSLQSITIPDSVTKIGYNLFGSREEIKTIKGRAGSYAEAFAKGMEIPFEVI
jgi:hypothetical protein